MKLPNLLPLGMAIAILSQFPAWAEEPVDEIPALRQVAENFIIAFNEKDAAAVAALFAEQGEISDLKAKDLISGRGEIQAHYAARLAAEDAPQLAIEVESVRLLGPSLAVEDGTAHYTPPGQSEPARSMSYTAVLQKSTAGAWEIVSSRNLGDATEPAGNLADLAASLKGDWTSQSGDLRLDIAFGWDDSGNYLAGEMLATRADAKPLHTTIRFGWDAARKVISCWTFDDEGGFAKADWTASDAGWIVRSEGTTADGEAMSANQTLTFESKDVFIWAGSDRLVDGQKIPDSKLRVVRQTPEPALGSDSDSDPE